MANINQLFLLAFLFICTNLFGQQDIEALKTALQTHYEASDLPGFAVAIINENGTLFQEGFGYANKEKEKPFTTDIIENLGSVSKTVVGVALIKAIEDNKLTLDAPINDFLPFKVVNPHYPETPILVRHLATHTSSILDTKNYGKTYIYKANESDTENMHLGYLEFIKSHEKMSLEDFLANILDKEGDWYKKKNYLKAKPGTQNEYSNLNAALMASIIENATGTSFEAYTQEKIFEPLNMQATTWSLNDIAPEKLATVYFPSGLIVPRYSLITYPDGGLYSSISDLSLYLNEMIKAYAGKSKFLKPKFAKLLLPGDEDENRVFWGMGQKSRNIGHGGSDPGVQTDLQFNADSKIGRIIICNVNAEDSEELEKQYNEIHKIIRDFEQKVAN